MRLDIRTNPTEASYYQVIDRESGQILTGVLAADDEESWYEVYKFDDKGQHVKDADGEFVVLVKQARLQFRYMAGVT